MAVGRPVQGSQSLVIEAGDRFLLRTPVEEEPANPSFWREEYFSGSFRERHFDHLIAGLKSD